MLKKRKKLPAKDVEVLKRYAIWNLEKLNSDEIPDDSFCEPCQSCCEWYRS